jgi:alpha-galactosidase/6-phospho-beta-glucosidase family protein
MEILGCATRGELYLRTKSGLNHLRWMLYLEYKDELENERMKAMMGEQP